MMHTDGKHSSWMKLTSQLSTMLANQLKPKCSGLENMVNRHVDSIEPMTDSVLDMLNRLTTNFDGLDVDANATEDKAKMLKLLKVARDTLKYINEDKTMTKMVYSLFKIMGKNHGGKHEGGGRHPGDGGRWGDEGSWGHEGGRGQEGHWGPQGNWDYEASGADGSWDNAWGHEEGWAGEGSWKPEGTSGRPDESWSNEEGWAMNNTWHDFDAAWKDDEERGKEGQDGGHGKGGPGGREGQGQEGGRGQGGPGGRGEGQEGGRGQGGPGGRGQGQEGGNVQGGPGGRGQGQGGGRGQGVEFNQEGGRGQGQGGRGQGGEFGQEGGSGKGQGGRVQGGRGQDGEFGQQGGRGQGQGGGGQGGRGQGSEFGQEGERGKGQGGRGQGGRGQGSEFGQEGGRGQGQGGKGKGGRGQDGAFSQQGGRGQGQGGRGQGGGGQGSQFGQEGGRGQGQGGHGQGVNFGQGGTQGQGQGGGERGQGGSRYGEEEYFFDRPSPSGGEFEQSDEFGPTSGDEMYPSKEMIMEDLRTIKEKDFETVYTMVEDRDATRLTGLLKHNKKDVTNIIYERFSAGEVKKLEELIYKRLKRDNYAYPESSKINFDKLDIDNLPPLDEMSEDQIDDFFDSLNDFEDDFSSMWNEADDTDSGWFRRKRQANDYMRQKMMKARGQGQKYGMSMSRMLQKMMMMAEQGDTPPIARDGSRFVKELLFMPDEDPTSVIGSRLPAQLRADIREILMLFLKDEMPLDVMKTEGKMLSYVGKSMEKLMNGLLPVSNDALNKTFARIELKLTNRTATNNSEERRVWQWVKLIQSTFDDEIKQNLTNMMKKIQGNSFDTCVNCWLFCFVCIW